MTVRQTGPNQRRTPLAHLYSGAGLSAYLGEERIMATDLYQQLIDNGWEPDEIICAWCGKHLAGPKDAPPERTSHSICPGCERKHFPDGSEATE